jgi:hypothetical protein
MVRADETIVADDPCESNKFPAMQSSVKIIALAGGFVTKISKSAGES